MGREIRFRGYYKGDHHFKAAMVYGNGVISGKDYATIADEKNRMYWSVKPETVGQYTGLKDKNGREVYEGDVVTEGGGVHVIEWNNDAARFEYKTKTGSAGLYAFYGEVIGNIYENPELLENREE